MCNRNWRTLTETAVKSIPIYTYNKMHIANQFIKLIREFIDIVSIDFSLLIVD